MTKHLTLLLHKIFQISLFTGLAFWGCEDTKTSESEPINPLIGNWTLTSVFVTVYSNPTQTLNFVANGETTYGTMMI